MNAHTILLVEDDISLQKSIAYILDREGFRVHACPNGEAALDLARRIQPDLILLDVMLPGIDGFTVCRSLKSDNRTASSPVVMLTGRSAADDIVRGLQGEADDYITKPFEPKVLLARLHAILRRRSGMPAPQVGDLVFADLLIRPSAREVRLGGDPITLTKTEFDLLHLLASRPNQVFSRCQILDHIRSDAYPTGERAVDFQITQLRRKLGAAGVCIQTVRGVGYKFTP